QEAGRAFLDVLAGGLHVRKYHRGKPGSAERVLRYVVDKPHGGGGGGGSGGSLTWDTRKWWRSRSFGAIPLRDVLDVERLERVVWVKCLHLGNLGLEAS
ncbi:unnamed protein product, partial [Phaeothamnion confervicola]